MIRGISAEESNQLHPDQWVNVWHIRYDQTCDHFGFCQVKELAEFLQDECLEEFGLELLSDGD